jgi:CelD/BcsL family acetyltransferase involved in cellulose biosynthesis
VGKILISKTQIIDLTLLDPGNPMRDWERDARRRVRGAVRDKVQVRTARSEADWERYYELYRLSLDRWGNKKTGEYPKALFDDIRRSLMNTSSIQLWVAERDGTIGAGYLAFCHNRHFSLWHGAADESFFKLGAAQLLISTLIQDALQRGFSIFDLGGSSGLAGVEAFKRQFGARTIEFESSLNRPGFPGFLAGLRDALKSGQKKIHITR